MPRLELPEEGVSLDAGQALVLTGAGARRVWEVLAGAPGRPRRRVLYEGTDIASWPAEKRRAAGLLALFEEPAAPAGMTLPQLARESAAGSPLRGLGQALRARAAEAGLPEGLLEAALDDARWRGRGAAAEWLQAVCLAPRLVVSLAPVEDRTLPLVQGLLSGGAAVVLCAPGAAPRGAERRELA